MKRFRRTCRLRSSLWIYSSGTLSVSSGDRPFRNLRKQGSQVLWEIGIIEGVFNVFPCPEPRIKLHVDQCTGDRAVAEPLLYLEQVGTGLVVVKRMSMPEGVETVSPITSQPSSSRRFLNICWRVPLLIWEPGLWPGKSQSSGFAPRQHCSQYCRRMFLSRTGSSTFPA